MNKEELETLKESIERAVENVTSRIWDLEDTLDKFKDRMNETRDALDDLPAEDLNSLLIKGFIPGVKFKCDDAEYQFKGYTETGRMEFINAKGESRFGDISSCGKMLDRFTMLKDNEQEETDK